MKIFTRYELISHLLKENGLSEQDRVFVAGMPDEIIFMTFGKAQFKELRKGYYTLN